MVKALNNFNEKKLVYRVRVHKDTEAFGELYDRYVSKIYRFTYLKVSHKEEAEDITSDVFLKTWNYLTDVQREADKEIKSFSGLIYTIARTSLVDFFRSRARRKECTIEVLEAVAHDANIEESTAREQQIEAILKNLKMMKREYQEIIVFKYIEELTTAEIGQILNKSTVSVRVTLHRALQILKKMLEEKKKKK
ncbi:MAG TPA: sigma-70 family RNA polymerase sigma factor [Candidatus Magasanikbacteria bacterium]|nr:sigma-70 family RNA polymerase sigma factor [Candidatus Magasanikbacteria bacterium]